MKKEEWSKLIGHGIREDTYILLERMRGGEKYDDVIKDIDNNREKYHIKKYTALSKKETVEKYLLIANNAGINEEKIKLNNIENKHGIYGIYVNNILIYIGKTTTSFKARFQQHKYFMNVEKNKDYLYQILKCAKQNNQTITLKPLIVVEDLKVQYPIKDRDLDAMELALITLYKPQCNIEGRIKNYRFF